MHPLQLDHIYDALVAREWKLETRELEGRACPVDRRAFTFPDPDSALSLPEPPRLRREDQTEPDSGSITRELFPEPFKRMTHGNRTHAVG